MNFKSITVAAAVALLASCAGCPDRAARSIDFPPPIFPDYTDVTVPCNIAPLNFMIDDADFIRAEFFAVAESDGIALPSPESFTESPRLAVEGRRGLVDIPIDEWRALLDANRGRTLAVRVSAWGENYPDGVCYAPFAISVSADPIDGWAAYRLMEPGYEGWLQMGIYQRDLSTFTEKVLVDNSVNGMGCVNCHSFCDWSPDRMMFHSRSDGGGTVFWQDGEAKKVNLAGLGPKKQGTYPKWNPRGRYVAYSSNETYQTFYAKDRQVNETFDTASDIIIYDTESGKVLTDDRFLTPERWESYPEWTPEADFLLFASAAGVNMPAERRDLHYDLLRVPFDRETGRMGERVDTLYNSRLDGGSAAYPRVSPDGRYLMYTRADYGTFPVWHKEADLAMIDLRDGSAVDVSALNSDCSESYHSWSSSGRWVVFASRRLDNRYARMFIAHVSPEGVCGKPFLLPQRNPEHNMWRMKSYNIPELVKGEVKLPKERLRKLLDAPVANRAVVGRAVN